MDQIPLEYNLVTIGTVTHKCSGTDTVLHYDILLNAFQVKQAKPEKQGLLDPLALLQFLYSSQTKETSQAQGWMQQVCSMCNSQRL
jgi:hypothetical protein